MNQETHIVSSKTFAAAWVLLIVLALVQLWLSTGFGPSTAKDFVILFFMAIEAYLVCFYFMHLRFENMAMILTVVLGIVLTTLLLYALIMWDGFRIFQLKAGAG